MERIWCECHGNSEFQHDGCNALSVEWQARRATLSRRHVARPTFGRRFRITCVSRVHPVHLTPIVDPSLLGQSVDLELIGLACSGLFPSSNGVCATVPRARIERATDRLEGGCSIH